MDIKKFAPWNWFKKEEEEPNATIPIVQRSNISPTYSNKGGSHPLAHVHHEMDRLFEEAFRGFGMSPFRTHAFPTMENTGFLKPQVDIGATEKEYSITVEVPGVAEKDVRVEVTNNTMTICGEKKQEKEEKDKNYYRVERSYGSFQRVLSLPDDADQDNIKATFNNGILTITMPRKSLPQSETKKIQIN
ncbi:Hsp20/alpha crystallin family protein [Desulfogranum japonicum]|uniref:Hsp20/alpha crystallin family protein n=1 Tax=Desulfogranum japonicum TaxID=231447 RepID=UPI00048BCC3F|nr:Hsp20/alpha crystallin family protein [Desulfogranum japonicum]